jgi:hypothetical protein
VFGDLPKIFDRNFIVAYFLPAAGFLAVSLGMVHEQPLITVIVSTPGVGFVVAALLLGVVLVGANRSVTRLLEGYDKRNPVRILDAVRLNRFRKLRRRLSTLDKKYERYAASDVDVPQHILDERTDLMTELAERFPDQEKWLLPSAFGNAMRAFEIYSRVMYGFDIIEGWSRLLTVIPKDYRDLLDTAKADSDLWVNVWFLSLVTSLDVAYALLRRLVVGVNPVPTALWIAGPVSFVVALFAAWMATKSAVEWGSLFKAATDVYLPDLHDKLRFPPTTSNEVVRVQWEAFSQAIMFRRPDIMPDRRWVQSQLLEASSPRENGTRPASLESLEGNGLPPQKRTLETESPENASGTSSDVVEDDRSSKN